MPCSRTSAAVRLDWLARRLQAPDRESDATPLNVRHQRDILGLQYRIEVVNRVAFQLVGSRGLQKAVLGLQRPVYAERNDVEDNHRTSP